MNYVKLAQQTVKTCRKKVGKTPEETPIFWKGLQMSVEEACAVILLLETEKAKYLKRYRNTQAGSRITKTAFDGTAEALRATAKGLKTNPITALAGVIVGSVESSVVAMGKVVNTGISETGELSNTPLIDDLKQQIEMLEHLVEKHRSQPAG